MRVDVVTLFPDYLDPLRLSLPGKAIASGAVDLAVHDLRRWTDDRHRTVDDTPYGGGAGMVLMPEPWGRALDDLVSDERVPCADPRLVMLTPSGRPFTQALAAELATEEHLVLACGRYEGFDARIAAYAETRVRVTEVSVGDYVLNGGEAAALVVLEAVIRLLPGVLGNPESLLQESHAAAHQGWLEYPAYTKPPHWRGLDVPGVLFSGHHARIAAWRAEQARDLTARRRPELLPPTLSIEPAVVADAGEVLTVQRAAFLSEAQLVGRADLPPLTEELDEVRSAIADPTGVVLVARWGPRLVGAVRGRAVDADWDIGRLVVVPDRQGEGIGAALMTAVEGLAPAGLRSFRLFTSEASAVNRAFYQRRGYLEVDRQILGAGPVELVIMRKNRRAAPENFEVEESSP